jgi:HlyD family secretion protein
MGANLKTRRTFCLTLFGVATLLVLRGRNGNGDLLTLYGNVDMREVQVAFEVKVAFNDTDRIVEMFVQEGDSVRAGELLAQLDYRRYAANANQARRTVEAQ